MNTLGKSITAAFFEAPEGYAELEQYWSSLVNSDARKELEAVHYLLYAALRGKDWRAGFTAATNAVKLENGHRSAAMWAIASLHSKWSEQHILAPFCGKVSLEMLVRMRAVLPTSYKGPEAEAYEAQNE